VCTLVLLQLVSFPLPIPTLAEATTVTTTKTITDQEHQQSDGDHKITSSRNDSPNLDTSGVGCASPEVLVNGSPSPDILETVNGGHSLPSGVGTIQEIQFVGVVGVRGEEKKRICRIKCLNGVWVGPLCTLEPECPLLESNDTHLTISAEGNGAHDRTRFSCPTGFFLEGPEESVCTTNGSWSHPVPKCRAIMCPELESDDPELRIDISSRRPGGEAHFSCPPGLKVTGASSSTCLSNGSWSEPSLPECEVITCQPPPLPLNGKIIYSGHFKTGDYVQYLCNPGYVQAGESISVCLENGSWTLPGPECKAVCDFPGEPENGYIVPTKFNYNIGEGISVVCKQNYQPLGPAFVYCNSEGKWSSLLPSCRQEIPFVYVADGQKWKQGQQELYHHQEVQQSELKPVAVDEEQKKVSPTQKSHSIRTMGSL